MKKRPLTLLLLFLFLSVILAGIPSVSADMGPKPITWITVRGLEKPYDFDLLVKCAPESVGPVDLGNEDNFRYYYLDAYPITALNGYQDSEGYASYTLYGGDIPHNISEEEAETPGDRVFQIGYFHPPKVFKIALSIEGGALVVSPVIETTMFYSYVTYDLSADQVYVEGETAADFPDLVPIHAGTVDVEIPVGKILVDFVLRVALTLAVELALLLAFGYRSKKSFLLVLWVNLVSQSLLLGGLLAGNYVLGGTFGAWFILILGEFPVLAAELAFYVPKLKEKTRIRAVLYTLAANLLSFALSFWSVIWLL